MRRRRPPSTGQSRRTCVKRADELEEVAAEPVRLERLGRRARTTPPKRSSASASARSAGAASDDRAAARDAPSAPRLAEDRADARVRVLQVRRGVALEREHAVPVEDVVLDAVAREVGVLHRADADRARDRARASRRRASGFFSRDDVAARARSASSSRSVSFTVSPLAGLEHLACPRRAPSRTRRARRAPAARASRPSRAAAKTIARCCSCGAPTT